jgi:energy-coupling factor transport system substrate-specific component
MSLGERIQKDFTTITLVLIPVAIVINIVVGQLVKVLRIPIYGDSIGTVLAAALGGPLVGAITGVLTNVLWGIIFSDPTVIPFGIVGGVIGLLAGIFAARGVFKSLIWTIVAGLVTGFIAAVISAPIATYVFGGVTGAGTDLLVAAFQSMGASILQASLGQGIVSDPLDKTVSFVIVWVILRGMSKRLLSQFPRGATVLGDK